MVGVDRRSCGFTFSSRGLMAGVLNLCTGEGMRNSDGKFAGEFANVAEHTKMCTHLRIIIK